MSSYSHPGSPPLRPEVPDGVELPPPAPPSEPPPGEAPGPEGLPRWPVWAPFAGMALTAVLAVVGTMIIGAGAGLAGADVQADDPPTGVTLAGTFLQDLALIGSALFLANSLDGRPTPRLFGLRETSIGRAAGRTALVWGAFFAFSAVWALALGIDSDDDLPQDLGADESTVALVAVTVLVTVVAPIGEEFFFRGFCFTALRRRIGVAGGAILTGAIFGAIHLGSSDLEFIVPLAVFGALLCLLYWWTESLLPCIVLHALNNSLALGVSQEWGGGVVLLLMIGASAAVLGIGVSVARSPRLNAAPAT